MTASEEILLADARVRDVSVLLDGLKPGVGLRLIRPDEDATSILGEQLLNEGARTIHILAHGEAGSVKLGLHGIELRDLSRLPGVGAREVDICLWCCGVGAGAVGARFLQRLARQTGARVHASTQAVGHADLGGSWTLDCVADPLNSELAELPEASHECGAHKQCAHFVTPSNQSLSMPSDGQGTL